MIARPVGDSDGSRRIYTRIHLVYQPTARRKDVPTIVGLSSLLLVLSGCCGSFSATWIPVKVMPASTDATVCLVPWNRASTDSECDQAGSLDAIRKTYDRAVQMESDCQPHCVDLYFQVATATLPFDGPLPQGTFNVCGGHANYGCSTTAFGRDLHKSALSRLVHSGQRFGRFDPGKQLTVHTGSQVVHLPLHRDGFLWRPGDFRYLRLVGDYRTDAIDPLYRTAGRGVPLVVETARGDDDPLVMPNVPFAATLCMTRSNEDQSSVRLTLHDPLRSSQRPGRYRCNDAQPESNAIDSTDIATDISAPLAYRLSQRSGTSLGNVTSLSDSTGPCRLAAIEPYQPGKIPVVFIHGLGSSPATWVQMVNALRSHPDLISRFQYWEFEYPRGLPYPTAARKLRSELIRVRHAIDPDFTDDALSNCVGVGHSLGGLIAKVISTTPDIDQDPACRIRRIVHIGTPHRGAVPSNRALSILVDGVRALRGNIPQDHVPGCPHRSNNIDLTIVGNPYLVDLNGTPPNKGIVTHSIIGDRFGNCVGEPCDGIVTVDSARDFYAVSERMIHTRHSMLNKHAEAIEEVIRILRLHRLELQSCPAPVLLHAPLIAPASLSIVSDNEKMETSCPVSLNRWNGVSRSHRNLADSTSGDQGTIKSTVAPFLSSTTDVTPDAVDEVTESTSPTDN